MKLGLTLKAGIAVSAAVAAITTAQAAAVIYFGNNPTANGGVVNGVGANQDPVAQRDLFRNRLTSIQTENFEARIATPGVSGDFIVSNVFSAGSGVELRASNPNGGQNADFTQIQQNTFGGTPTVPGTSGFLGRFSTTNDPTSTTTLNGGFNYTGGKWWETNYKTVTIDFGNTSTSAFGTFMTDLGDFNGSLLVEVFSGLGSATLLDRYTLLSPQSSQGNGGLGFFGYINDTSTFNRVVFSITQGTTDPSAFDTVGFDDLLTGQLRTTGPTVPEPTSLALVGLSLALLGFSRRRKTAR